MMRRFMLSAAALLLGSLAAAQGVGSTPKNIELEDLAQTEATSYDQFLGRAVLLEFFAFW